MYFISEARRLRARYLRSRVDADASGRGYGAAASAGRGFALKPPERPPSSHSLGASLRGVSASRPRCSSRFSRQQWQPSGLSGNSVNIPSNKSVNCTCPPQGWCFRRLRAHFNATFQWVRAAAYYQGKYQFIRRFSTRRYTLFYTSLSNTELFNV